MSQQLLRRAWNFIDTIKQVYPEHWSPEEQVLLDDLMKADLDLSSVKREWVGLTDEEIDQGLLRSDYALQTAHAWRAGVVFAMTQLKEKNT